MGSDNYRTHARGPYSYIISAGIKELRITLPRNYVFSLNIA